jgi:hypothetical protein
MASSFPYQAPSSHSTTLPDGGQDYLDKLLQETHRNILVWLQNGSDEHEHQRLLPAKPPCGFTYQLKSE